MTRATLQGRKQTLQSAAVATGAGVVMDISGMVVVAVDVTIAASATITFEAAIAGGTMRAISATNIATGAVATTATASGIYTINCAGLTDFQSRISTWGSGAVTALAVAYANSGGALAGASTTAISGPLDRRADAQAVSVALSTEDVALLNSLITKLNGGLPAALGAGGGLKVDGSGTALPVSGTVTASGTLGIDQTTPGTTDSVSIKTTPAEGIALSSAARTTLTSSADFTNLNARGLFIVLSISAASGTGGLTLRVQGKDISGNYVNINAAPTAQTASTNALFYVYPGAATAGLQTTSAFIPRTWRIQVTVGDASSYTYAVNYCYLA